MWCAKNLDATEVAKSYFLLQEEILIEDFTMFDIFIHSYGNLLYFA